MDDLPHHTATAPHQPYEEVVVYDSSTAQVRRHNCNMRASVQLLLPIM